MEALIRKSDVGISNTRREYNHQDREKYLAYLEQSRKTEGLENFHVINMDHFKDMQQRLVANVQLLHEMLIYVVDFAKDLADGGMVKTYQTEVLLALREGVWNVRAMRLKPGLDEQGDLLVAILKEDGSGKTRNLITGFQKKGEAEEAVLQKVVITDMRLRSYTASWNISCKFSFRS
ncbi:hypothetical protein C3L33_05494, partial [Rhododendron williamsianum]